MIDFMRVTPRVVAFVTLAGLMLDPKLARATVAEQRARLPPPAYCQDPVEGIWKGQIHRPQHNIWDSFTLEVRRKPGSKDELVGTIWNETWGAGAERQQPGPCSGLTHHFKVSQPATGSAGPDGNISFGATTFKVEEEPCGPQAAYLPDSFTGKIDPEIQEFQSLLNDGGAAVNLPTVFRRVKCFDGPPDEKKTKPFVDPPPFMPPRNEGCGL